MTGSTLSVVRQKLLAAVGATLTGTTVENQRYNLFLEAKQFLLASAHDWPHLRTTWNAYTTSGNRFVALPTTDEVGASATINFDRPVTVTVNYSNLWLPVAKGILTDYNLYDKTDRSDPPVMWQVHGTTELELWPTPASSLQLRLTGQRRVSSLRDANGAFDDSKTFDLDDDLLVYFTAADILTRANQRDAQLWLTSGEARLKMLRASASDTPAPWFIGEWAREKRPRRHVIATVGASLPNGYRVRNGKVQQLCSDGLWRSINIVMVPGYDANGNPTMVPTLEISEGET